MGRRARRLASVRIAKLRLVWNLRTRDTRVYESCVFIDAAHSLEGRVRSPVNETVFATGARQTVPCTRAITRTGRELFMYFGLEGVEAVHVGSVVEENRSLLMVLFNGRVSVYDSGG